MKKYSTMSFGQLSSLYFPNVTSSAARRKMRDWIRCNSCLQSALFALGYKEGCRILTPKMVMLVMQHLGEP